MGTMKRFGRWEVEDTWRKVAQLSEETHIVRINPVPGAYLGFYAEDLRDPGRRQAAYEQVGGTKGISLEDIADFDKAVKFALGEETPLSADEKVMADLGVKPEYFAAARQEEAE